MKQSVNRVITGLGVCLLGTALMTVSANELESSASEFAQTLKLCEKMAAANPDTGSGTYFAADSCYKFQVQMTLTANKQPGQLTAALQAAPQFVDDTVEAALQVGMNSYDVVAVATAALPQSATVIAQRALAYGAEPSTILQATAAGR